MSSFWEEGLFLVAVDDFSSPGAVSLLMSMQLGCLVILD